MLYPNLYSHGTSPRAQIGGIRSRDRRSRFWKNASAQPVCCVFRVAARWRLYAYRTECRSTLSVSACVFFVCVWTPKRLHPYAKLSPYLHSSQKTTHMGKFWSIWVLPLAKYQRQVSNMQIFCSLTLRHRNSEKRSDTEKRITDPCSAYLTLLESAVRSSATKITFKFVAQCYHTKLNKLKI